MGVKVREWKKGEWWILIAHKGKRKSVKVGSKEAAKAAARKIEEALTTGKLNLKRIRWGTIPSRSPWTPTGT